jgi:hypothetical protein
MFAPVIAVPQRIAVKLIGKELLIIVAQLKQFRPQVFQEQRTNRRIVVDVGAGQLKRSSCRLVLIEKEMGNGIAEFAVVREEFASVLQLMNFWVKLQAGKFEIVQANGLRLRSEIFKSVASFLIIFRTCWTPSKPR